MLFVSDYVIYFFSYKCQLNKQLSVISDMSYLLYLSHKNFYQRTLNRGQSRWQAHSWKPQSHAGRAEYYIVILDISVNLFEYQ